MRASTDTRQIDTWTEPGQLGLLLEENRQQLLGKFVGDENLSEDKLWHSMVSEIENRVSHGKALLEVQQDLGTHPLGVVVGEIANWESEHYRRKMGKVTLATFDRLAGTSTRATLFRTLAKRLGVDMLSARVRMSDLLTVQALERAGAILVDVLMTFRFSTRKMVRGTNSSVVSVSPSTNEEAEELIRMGGRIFTVDRFHGDPNLPKSRSDELYSKWVSNSLAGFADIVLVARHAGRVAGFITCKTDKSVPGSEYGVIDLVGVNPDFSGKGIGQELVRSALEWFGPRVRSVYVGTQAANTRAIRLYEKSGFVHVCSDPTLHLWFPTGS